MTFLPLFGPNWGLSMRLNGKRPATGRSLTLRVMMHGYGALMRDFNQDLATLRPDKGQDVWAEKLKALASSKVYTMGDWSGDFFDKHNPLWTEVGIVKRGRGQSLTTLNTGAARLEAGRVLRQLVNAPSSTQNIAFLATR